MPNYVNYRLEIKAPSEERLEEILNSIQSVNKEDGTITPIDFNSIDPMPEELSMEFSLGEEMVARYLVRDLLDPVPNLWATKEWNSLTEEEQKECTPNARRMIENILKYGYPNWYAWRCDRWGTKWNVLESSREKRNVILFQTAWSLPDNLLKTLSSKFGDTTFKVTYADESIGCNCGIAEYKNGEGTYHEPTIGSIEAFELAFSLWPNRREDYVLTENGYEGKEE